MTPSDATQPAAISPAGACRDGTARRTCLHVALLLLVCGALFFCRVGTLPLQDPDESRCALIVREMLRTGDWLVPHCWGEPYLKKPAPFFWLAAVGQRLTGNAEMGGRGVAALAGVAAVLVTYFFARRTFGPLAGLVAGVTLATSGMFVFVARWFRMDMPFVAAMWAAVWFFWRSEAPPDREGARRGRFGWYGFYLFCAAATLFKGPAGLLLPVMVVGSYLLLSGRPRRVFELLHVGGILLYLLIAAPWFVAVGLREPGYAYEFLVRENLARFAGHPAVGDAVSRRDFLGIVYLPILLGGFLPWTAFLPAVCVRYFPRRWRLRARRPGVLLLWVQVFIPLVLFAFSGTKMVHYILPAFAPLAVMTGGVIAGWGGARERAGLLKGGAAALFAMVVMVALLPVVVETWLGCIDVWMAVPVAAAVVAVCGTWISLRRGRRAACVGWTTAAVVTMFLFFIVHTAPVGYDMMSTRALAKLIDPATVPSAKFCYYRRRRESIAYYSGAAGAEKFTNRRTGDLQKLAELMASGQRVYCLVSSADRLADLKRTCPKRFFVLGKSGGRWLVTNRRPERTTRGLGVP